MSFNEYPKWKYSARDSRVVENADEEQALDGEWFDTPCLLKAAQDEKARVLDAEQRAKRLAEGGSIPGQGDGQKPTLDKVPGGEPPTEREALKAAADKLSITYPANIPSAKLEELIKAKIEQDGE